MNLKKFLKYLFPKISFGIIIIGITLIGMGFVGGCFIIKPFILSQLTGVVLILIAGYILMWWSAFKEEKEKC